MCHCLLWAIPGLANPDSILFVKWTSCRLFCYFSFSLWRIKMLGICNFLSHFLWTSIFECYLCLEKEEIVKSMEKLQIKFMFILPLYWLQGSAKNLPPVCTSRLKPHLVRAITFMICFLPFTLVSSYTNNSIHLAVFFPPKCCSTRADATFPS